MLFLEEFKAHGFKSYAEEVTASFNPGIGVIIGNNGVGKSNILDAITWALGEDDLGKLRCYSTEDLFYTGGKDHPRAEEVRVELRFKKGPDKNDESFVTSRCLDRSGIESYFIEGDRLSKDAYRERLFEFGLGDALKSLVRQEELNDFLQLHPCDRLEYFRFFVESSAEESDNGAGIEAFDAEFRRLYRGMMARGDGRVFIDRFNGRSGLEIEVTFPDKGTKKARFLSGGEKTVASLAAKLALFGRLQSPFYLLDEVEPSLDWTNHRNMSNLLKDLAKRRQLIMITHLRSTIEVADTVHGVRTQFDGSSFMKFHFVMDKRLLRLYKCC